MLGRVLAINSPDIQILLSNRFAVSTAKKLKITGRLVNTLSDIKKDDIVSITMRTRRGWSTVTDLSVTVGYPCTTCKVLHKYTTKQLCDECEQGESSSSAEFIQEQEPEVLKISSKKYKFSKGATITLKTRDGRVLVSTVFENSRHYPTILSLGKGEIITGFTGWFDSPFPDEPGDDLPGSPDGFFNLETITV